MPLDQLLNDHRPVTLRDLLAAIRRAGGRDAFEADGFIYWTESRRVMSCPATPGDVLAATMEPAQ